MFDLDQAISKWRRQMFANGIQRTALLDELESHLREDVEERIQSGSDVAAAFELAAQSIGRGPLLKAEFAKLDAKPNLLPLIFRITCFVSAPFMLLVSAWALLDSDGPSIGGLAALFMIWGLGSCVGSLPFWYRWLPNPYRKVVGISLKAMSFLVSSFPIFALLGALEIIQLPVGTAVSMFAWSFVTAFVATVLAYVCLDLERGVGWGIMACPPTDKFTELAQRAIEIAYDEAGGLGHDYVGTEHLLLGVISSESGLVTDLLRKWETDQDTIRLEVEKMIGPGVVRKSARDIPYTPRAKRSLTLAQQEARSMGHPFITPEHILLGLLLETEGVAGLVLRNLGINAEAARRDILDGMGPGGDHGSQPVPV